MTRTLRPFAIARAATASRQPTLRPMAAALDTARDAPVALTRLRPMAPPASSPVTVGFVEEAETPLERAVRVVCEASRIRAAEGRG